MDISQRLSREKILLAIAAMLVAAGFGYAYLTSPTWLTVAVGPAGSPDEKLLRAFAAQLKTQRSSVRLKLLPVADVRAAAEALDKDEASLAVARPDVLLPAEGLTVAILREAAAIIVAPSGDGLKDVSDLNGKTLGVALGHPADAQFVEAILQHFDLAPPHVTIQTMSHEEALSGLQEKRIDAIVLIAPPAGTVASGFVRSIARAFSGEIKVFPIENSDAIVQRSLGASALTIPEGAWGGGKPKTPDRDVKTVGVTYRLMARSDLDRSTVSSVTEALFQMRSRLAMTARSAIFMKAPETDANTAAGAASLPNHPGAVDYFQREQQTVMDRWGDWIYLGAFFGSGLLSALAALWTRFRRQTRAAIDDVLDRLIAILEDARKAQSHARLDEIAAEVDKLLALAVGYARTGETGSQTTSALVLALDGARSAIEDRRKQIGAEPAGDGSRRDAPRLVSLLSAGQGSTALGRGSPST